MFEDYVQSVTSKFYRQETSEYGYRTDFENLLNNIFKDVKNLHIANDPKAIERKKPDFIVFSGEVPIVYFETKDVGIDLDKEEKSEQMKKYYGYANLVLTDYLEFRFFRNGIKYCEPIEIADYDQKYHKTEAKTQNYELLGKTIQDFPKTFKEPIKSGVHLAKIMGGKAQRIRDNIRQFYSLEADKNTDLIHLYQTIKKQLVHDLDINSFSDMYAQTLVYGLFVARYYDDTPGDFTRGEARELIPNSNRLLRHFFDHIVGADFDNRLKYVVDELCEIFSHANVHELMKDYFQDKFWEEKRKAGPVIHFYQDFLEEYDTGLRKKMGAYYTPQPVVDFIINSVDYILKQEFKLSEGIADITKTEKGVHKVQILDPATGTGTFLSTIIGNIYQLFLQRGQKGAWPGYVHHDLLPRIFGFELMMAPYTIAHLRLGIAFRKTGFWDFRRRLGIYLTNSLEESVDQQNLFGGIGLSESIAEESKEAFEIKNNNPIMVVIGNPPYFGESSNKNYHGHDVYKFEPAGGKLQEKNSKWLNDDYVKFIRFAESLIEKNGSGVIAMITAHGYIDNPTFRGMRWHLMETFNEIYVLDLHGNKNKREKAPDGGDDDNIFDIKTGVAILIGVKRSTPGKKIAKIYKAELFGPRLSKFNFLSKNFINSVKWQLVLPSTPNYEWIAKDKNLEDEYLTGFSIDDLFVLKNTGIVTKRDKLCIHFTKEEMWQAIQDFINLPEGVVRKKYKVGNDVRDWKYEWAKKDLLRSGPSENNIVPISYRPFDTRYMYYTGNARGFVGWPVERISKQYLLGKNTGLLVTKSHRDSLFRHAFITDQMSEVIFLSGITGSNAINIPLYTYHEGNVKNINFSDEIFTNIKKIIKSANQEDVLCYIYATLYSSKYRNKYSAQLRRSFPRIPYPNGETAFHKLVKLGKELIQLHLLEDSKLNKFITTYEIEGRDNVENVTYKEGKIYINDIQYFGKVPENVWDFYIGGYQPAQMWLKYRKGRELTNEDIEHYQKIIVALVETDKIQRKIDEIIII